MVAPPIHHETPSGRSGGGSIIYSLDYVSVGLECTLRVVNPLVHNDILETLIYDVFSEDVQIRRPHIGSPELNGFLGKFELSGVQIVSVDVERGW